MNNEYTKYYSDIQEKKISSTLDWKQVSASGARPFNPGDIISDRYLGECKTHVKSNNIIEFKASVWEKIKTEAASQFRFPVLFVDDGSQKLDNTWCMFSYLPDAEYELIDIPVTFRKNIRFDNLFMKTKLKDYSIPVLFVVKSLKCYVSSFNDFKEICDK